MIAGVKIAIVFQRQGMAAGFGENTQPRLEPAPGLQAAFAKSCKLIKRICATAELSRNEPGTFSNLARE
jgi:hypothetical protein